MNRQKFDDIMKDSTNFTTAEKKAFVKIALARLDKMALKNETNKYQDGVPCSHPGCLGHIKHPCEVCGRFGAIGESAKLTICI